MNEIDAVLPAAVQALLADRPGNLRGDARVSRGDLPISDIDVLVDARQDVSRVLAPGVLLDVRSNAVTMTRTGRRRGTATSNARRADIGAVANVATDPS